jgi:hypothetical protein
METKGLIFIPDISGFTRFVKEVEIEHSRLIIQELLEILIDANNTGLIISEIEGDAILFYKFGERPSLHEVYRQVEKMFSAFHKSLMTYESRRYCQCNACLSAINLTLKVITHYGEFTEYNVKNFNKLIGKDVIVAHQLLKNDIDNHEYWLVTNQLQKDEALPAVTKEINWINGRKVTDEDDIPFRYTPLGHLKNELSVDPPPKPDLQKMSKVISVSREYDTDIITLFHAAGDFTYRHKWMEGVKKVEVKNHFLPRVGMGSRIISENSETTIYSYHYLYHDNKVEFSEIDEASGDVSYYTLEKLGTFKTRLTLDYYINKTLFSGLLFAFSKRSGLKTRIEKSLMNLVRLVEQIGDAVRKKAMPVE